MKNLKKMCHLNHSQFVLFIVDSKGKATIEASEAFQCHLDDWFPENVIKTASDITTSVASEMKARRVKNEEEQSGQKLEGKAGDGEGFIDDDEEYFEDDAEHEDDEGHSRPGDTNDGSIPKHILHYPPDHPPPPSMFGASPPRIRKRTLPTVKSEPKRRRRSSAKPLPVQRSASSSGETNSVAQSGVTYRPLMIANVEAVTTFFETRFRQMQQLTCKVVAKAWIKVIEPKKQSNFPYNRGEESKPSWWPAGARHKEPDHLMKPERLLLLMTMLRCRRVPVTKLEMATQEVAAHIEECRFGLLEEIYRVAKMEERFVAGTLPVDATCYVAASADKVVSNPKPQSPKSVQPPSEASEVSPTSGSPGTRETGRNNSMDMQVRQTPRQSPTELAAPTRPQSLPFSAIARPQSNIQSVHAQSQINFATPFMTTAQGTDEGYIKTEGYIETTTQSFVPTYYRASMSYHPNATPQMPRRANSIPQPQIPQQSFNGGWPIQVFSPYSTTTQQHQPQQSHHSPHGPHSLGGSNPSTPVTNSSFTQIQLLPPPLPPIHQHQTHNPLSSHHDISVTVPDRSPQYDTSRIAPHMNHSNVSFSEFLESPMPERAYDLAPGLGDDIVNIGAGRVQDQGSGLPGGKDMTHG